MGHTRKHKPHDLGPRVYRHGRSWWADLRPWNGQRLRIKDPSHPEWPKRGEPAPDEDIAREWAWAYVRALTGETRRRLLKQSKVERLDRAIERYLEHRKGVVADNTRSADQTALRHLAAVAGKTTDSLTLDTVQQLVDEGLRAGYAASTVRTWVTSLSPFFVWLGLPVTLSECVLPDLPKTEVPTWGDEECEQLREAADHVDRKSREPHWPSTRLVVETFLGMGTRQQEGFVVEWRRISARDKTVRIVYQLHRDQSTLVALKGKRARTALILPSFFENVAIGRSGYVLSNNPRALGYRSQLNLLARVLDTARLNEDGVGYHRFRHTYARHFIEQGGRIEELQKSLGHSSIVTTEREYGHYHEDVAASMARSRIYRTG